MVDVEMGPEDFFLAALKEFESSGHPSASPEIVKPPTQTRHRDPVEGIPTEGAMLQQKQELIEKLKEFGCKCVDVKGDGDCQFASISLLLHRNVNKKDIIRARAVEELRSHPNAYAPYVHGLGFVEYCDLMSRSYTWGDHLTLQALANSYDIRIIVITAKDRTHGVTSFEVSGPSAKSTYYLGFIQELHYMAAVEWPDEVDVTPAILATSQPIVPGPDLLAEQCAEFGLQLVIQDDGPNSMFAAFAALLGGSTSADYCRSAAVTELQNRPDLYEHQNEAEYQMYIMQLQQYGAHGDQRVLRALCAAMGVQITLLSLEGTKVLTSHFGNRQAARHYRMGCYSGRVYQPIF